MRQHSFHTAKQALIDKVKNRGDLPCASIDYQLELIQQLSEFGLGQFLIGRGGLNGYWTHYIISHPEKKHERQLYPLEAFLLNHAPICLATQQRFIHFKAAITLQIANGCSFASIPSGLMAEFLDLDYTDIDSFTLHGFDLDPETLIQAKSYAAEKGLESRCEFHQKDAWSLDAVDEFDLIASNGLTIYEPDDTKVVTLYHKFYNALKKGGTLVTSALEPALEPLGPNSQIDPKSALLQKILFVDILDVKWQVFRSEELVRAQLSSAGFTQIHVQYDEAHLFPTFIAKKE